MARDLLAVLAIRFLATDPITDGSTAEMSHHYKYRNIEEVEVIQISGIPATEANRIMVTVADTGQNVWLPRMLVDFGPGRVAVPAWLYLKIRPYISNKKRQSAKHV